MATFTSAIPSLWDAPLAGAQNEFSVCKQNHSSGRYLYFGLPESYFVNPPNLICDRHFERFMLGENEMC